MAPPRTLAAVLPALTDKTFGRRGLYFGSLVAHWREIAGGFLADRTSPHRVVFPPRQRENATLYLRATSSAGPELQHLGPVLLERINQHMGNTRAVARIKIIHSPIDRPRSKPPRLRTLSEAETKAIDAAVAVIADPEVNQALASLGRTLAAASQKSRR